jgi:hypothetical protein
VREVIRVRVPREVTEELKAAGINPSKEGRRHLENLAWTIRCRIALEQMSEVIRKRVKPSRKGFAMSHTRKDRDAHS